MDLAPQVDHVGCVVLVWGGLSLAVPGEVHYGILKDTGVPASRGRRCPRPQAPARHAAASLLLRVAPQLAAVALPRRLPRE